MKLALATPFYEVKAYSPYILSLLDSIKVLNELKMQWDFFEISGDSYVDRAKNTLAHRFMQSEYTHLFMIDSDLMWDVKGFMRIIKGAQYGCDVIGGTFPNKNNWSTFGAEPIKDVNGFPKGIEKDNMRLLEMNFMPGGFLIYTRKAFEMVQPLVNTYVAFDSQLPPEEGMNEYYEYFKCSVENSGEGRVGEDVFFQNKFKEAGGKIYLEPNIEFQHWGVKGWKGNYHDHLLRQKMTMEAQGIIE